MKDGGKYHACFVAYKSVQKEVHKDVRRSKRNLKRKLKKNRKKNSKAFISNRVSFGPLKQGD